MSSRAEDRAARMRTLTDQIIDGIKDLQSRPVEIRINDQMIASMVGAARSHGSVSEPKAAEVEIIELGEREDNSMIIPNEVRINGQSILCPDGQFVTVHPVSSNEVVSVTITMFVSKLTIRSEKRG